MSTVDPIKKILALAKKDPVLNEALSVWQSASVHMNLSGMVDMQKAYFVMAMAAAAEGSQKDAPIPVVIVSDELKARTMKNGMECFTNREVLVLRGREVSLSSITASSREIEHGRLRTLVKLMNGEAGGLIITAGAWLTKMMPYQEFISSSVTLRIGKHVTPEDLALRLVGLGYERTRSVEGVGEFAGRGDIIDVFPAGHEYGVRISFFDDEIDQIKYFDVHSQRSEEQLQKITFYPAREILLNEKTRAKLSQTILQEGEKTKKTAVANGASRDLVDNITRSYQKDSDTISGTGSLAGLERWVSLIYPDAVSILSYIKNMNVILFVDELLMVKSRMDGVMADFMARYKTALEKGQVLPTTGETLWRRPDLFREIDGVANALTLSTLASSGNGLPGGKSLSIMGRESSSFRSHEDALIKTIKERQKEKLTTVLMTGGGAREENLRKMLLENHALPEVYPYNLSSGFEYPTIGLLVIGSQDLFGIDRGVKKKRRKGMKIDLFSDLVPGELVVDDENGVGRYDGLVNLITDGVKRDYLQITYAGDDRLYIPMDRLDQIQKYVASDGREPKLARLGSQEWHRSVERAKSTIHKMAIDLVALYAKRQAVEGYAFSPDTVWQQQFEEDFEFVETPDQLAAVADIKGDMERPKPMDRLLCGDVGFGKTEVAFRAIFKCIMDGKQAILLAPTTVLVQQHYDNLCARLSGYPVKVGLLSRFASPTAMKQTVKGLNNGAIDVVVGTHRVLSADIAPKNLGLLVVDEEQRFGVAHKEKLKTFRNAVDVLTLTATPIPRTLNMSLSGIRDISVLEDPPVDRRAVQTYVMEYDSEIIAEACLREISRQGQVFYLFNDTRKIAEKVDELQALLPGATILYGHGKMAKNQLEHIIESFVNKEADILVCTTIIESGIDMPNVNTIIVEKSDRFGLAQLYQLKGRVGRSDRQAYAYITYEQNKELKEEAEKRLSAIRDFTELGSGLKIAIKDLEVRGAGNLLGEEQSGQMDVIGYELYCRMLDEEIKKLQGTFEEKAPETLIKMEEDAYISPDYIEDVGQRMDSYRRIRTISSTKEYQDVEDEFLDRFGDIPLPVQKLMDIALIRHLAAPLGFATIEIKADVAFLYYREGAKPNMEGLAAVIAHKNFKNRILFSAMKKPYIQYRPDLKERFLIVSRLREMMETMSNEDASLPPS